VRQPQNKGEPGILGAVALLQTGNSDRQNSLRASPVCHIALRPHALRAMAYGTMLRTFLVPATGTRK